jgi:hypothetical protein
MRQRGLINEAIEVLFEGTGHLRGAPGAWSLHQPLHPLVGKAIDPLAESRIRQGEGVRDGWATLPLHNVVHGLGTAQAAGCFGLLYAGVSGRERSIRKVQFAGPHLRVGSSTANRGLRTIVQSGA